MAVKDTDQPPAGRGRGAVDEEAAKRRADKAERADYHVRMRHEQAAAETGQAQAMVDRFVEQAAQAGLATEELTARPWSGGGARYRTGIIGWYLRRNHSIGVGVDGSYHLLNVPPVPLGRWRRVQVDPTPPPLEVGRGGRDGEPIALADLLHKRLHWGDSEGR